MAASIRPMSILKDLRKKQKIRTLIDHPKEVLKKHFVAIENLLARARLPKERLREFMFSECSLNSILHTAFNYSGYWTYGSICSVKPEQGQAK